MPKTEKVVATTTAQPIKTVVVNCTDCGRTFSITPGEQKFYRQKGYELPKRCVKCRVKRKITEPLICIDCGEEFEFKSTEREYYKQNNLFLPKRCHSCRKAKRQANLEKQKAEDEAAIEMMAGK